MYDVLRTPPSNDGSAYIKEIPHFCKHFYLSESSILTFLLKVVIFNLFSNRNEIEIACCCISIRHDKRDRELGNSFHQQERKNLIACLCIFIRIATSYRGLKASPLPGAFLPVNFIHGSYYSFSLLRRGYHFNITLRS